MKIDAIYLNILQKHNAVKKDTDIFYYYQFMDQLMKKLEALGPNSHFALLGNTFSGREMYLKLPIAFRDRCKCILTTAIDEEEKLLPVPHIALEDTPEEVQAIFCTVPGQTEAAQRAMAEKRYGTDVIDIYKEMETEEGLSIRPLQGTKNYWNVHHLYIDEQVQELKRTKEINKRAEIYKKIISDFLLIRDFENAKKYFSLAKNVLSPEEANGYSLLFEDIRCLLADIQTELKKKRTENVLLFVADGLPQESTSYMPLLADYFADGVRFTQSYAGAFFTKASFFSFLRGEPYLCTGNFAKEFVTIEGTALADFLIKEDIALKVFSPVPDLCRISELFYPMAPAETMPSVLWSLLSHLVASHKKTVYLLHLFESHPPYFNSSALVTPIVNHYDTYASQEYLQLYSCEDDDKAAQHSQAEAALEMSAWQYIDQQLHSFLTLVNAEKTSVALLSDHGHVRRLRPFGPEGKKPAGRERQKSVLMVHSPFLEEIGTYNCLFSMLDFPDIILAMLQGAHTLSLKERIYAQVEREPSYGLEMTRTAVFTHEKEFNHYHAGAIVLLNDEEEYIKNLDGYEMYRVSGNRINEIENPLYAKRIQQCRQLAQLDLPTMWNTFFLRYPETIPFFRKHIPVYLLPPEKTQL